MRLVFIHGRSQQGKDPSALRHEWLGALNKGLAQTGLSLPAAVEVRLPFYGDRLDAFTKASAVPLTDDLNTRGGEVDADFLAFEAAIEKRPDRLADIEPEIQVATQLMFERLTQTKPPKPAAKRVAAPRRKPTAKAAE